MLLSDFSYTLPEALIAQEPAEPRDSARLLVYERATGKVTHSQVRDIALFLAPHTTFIVNNTRVRKARLEATNQKGQKGEVVILEKKGSHSYTCLIGNLRGTKLKEILILPEETEVEVIGVSSRPEMTTYTIEFPKTLSPEIYFEKCGRTPLPPYIKNSTTKDSRYQTVYAQSPGSAAAPTAGLHFTEELIQTLKETGFSWEEVTLQVGLGTFLPLRNEVLTENILHQEETFISENTAKNLNQARKNGSPLLAVGTTSVRTLESHLKNGSITSGNLTTNLFIYPGFSFKVVDALLTNFHLPHSSLLPLVGAFIGNGNSGLTTPPQMIEELKRLYSIAIAEKYKFYSFGDAMLIR